MNVQDIVMGLIQLLVQILGSHEKAKAAITEDEVRTANAAADIVAAGRRATGL